MEEKTRATSGLTSDEAPALKPSSNWKIRLFLGVIALLILLGIYAIATIFMPVWWATKISSHNAGSATAGWVSGFSIGFVFALIPMLVLWQVRYRKLSWRGRAVIAIFAIVLALPNWLTLGIFWNSSDAAQKAQAILNTGATWFGGASLVGAISAAAISLILVISWLVFRRRGARIRDLEAQQKVPLDSTIHDEG
ncbi:hypothetical protein [Glutamicibacter sp.]|jgi:hypothetical protein|uniref:hypothetical protein n=1 Tax=Glutamicibacter sp. TaxID=1931995 RepID=UPI002B48D8ED|nr:hypothetical protein [Glutamicibacter sp.]HJX77226.1 hypothetical protein [Glutamicibacter sp.]